MRGVRNPNELEVPVLLNVQGERRDQVVEISIVQNSYSIHFEVVLHDQISGEHATQHRLGSRSLQQEDPAQLLWQQLHQRQELSHEILLCCEP